MQDRILELETQLHKTNQCLLEKENLVKVLKKVGTLKQPKQIKESRPIHNRANSIDKPDLFHLNTPSKSAKGAAAKIRANFRQRMGSTGTPE